jgi:hypothetical protein
MRASLLVVALLLVGCPADRSPFCARWFELDEAGREDEIRDRVEGWRDQVPVRGPYAEFMSCVGGYVVDRRGAVDSACRNLGDLEAGVTIGRLVAAGADACAALPRVPGP